MNRIKTLSLPLITAIVGSAELPANAQISLTLSSRATYRQNQGSKAMNFTGGNFDVVFNDGSVVSVAGCNYDSFYPAGYYVGACARGTTGFLTAGAINGATTALPYLLVTSIKPALVVAPRRADLVKLTAAPASGLPRPEAGFLDDSADLYFDLTSANSIQEYILTNYARRRAYGKGESQKFQEQIVPGVYHYSFPRLFNPILPAAISATIFPMTEGFAKTHSVDEGFKFTTVNDNKYSKDGFVELSYLLPNTFKWTQFSPAVTFQGSDTLSFSIRVIANQTNPKSAVVPTDKYSGALQAIFPSFSTSGDPRVALLSPFVTQFTTPPVLAGGTKGVVEVELSRNLQTGGVTYDFSDRKFQIPVVVVNRYSEYQETIIDGPKSNSLILKDTDGDGYNNLNEWILGSSAADPSSIPIAPVALDVPALTDVLTGRIVRDAYYGFTIDQKLGTRPGVVYTLQRSKDNGKTWKKFVSDADWTVRKVVLGPGNVSVTANAPKRIQIWVESRTLVEPPGTQNDIYRVKITLAK